MNPSFDAPLHPAHDTERARVLEAVRRAFPSGLGTSQESSYLERLAPFVDAELREILADEPASPGEDAREAVDALIEVLALELEPLNGPETKLYVEQKQAEALLTPLAARALELAVLGNREPGHVDDMVDEARALRDAIVQLRDGWQTDSPVIHRRLEFAIGESLADCECILTGGQVRSARLLLELGDAAAVGLGPPIELDASALEPGPPSPGE